MGGDSVSPTTSTSEEKSPSEQEFADISIAYHSLFSDGLSGIAEHGAVNGWNGFVPGEIGDMDRRVSSSILDSEIDQRRRKNAYEEYLRGYEELQRRSENLDEAKSKIMSYTSGAWIEMVGGMRLSDYDVPETTSLLLIGPRGAGKSSLVNKISRVFETDKFAPKRAEESYNSSFGDGTLFLKEYTISRGSTSICLYDTRSLCNDSSENDKMLKQWMTKGVRHGRLVTRDSDSSSLKSRMKYKAAQSYQNSSKIRRVDFVIFVVNGLTVLRSMSRNEEADTQYMNLIATSFNLPYLSFKDDKPVVVVTHGDLLSLTERARVCVYLGELLGIHPTKQIFDIPESCDRATKMKIVDMLCYSLEHADKSFPCKVWFDMAKDWFRTVEDWFDMAEDWFGMPEDWFGMRKEKVGKAACIFMLILLGVAIISAYLHGVHPHFYSESAEDIDIDIDIDWHAIRHVW